MQYAHLEWFSTLHIRPYPIPNSFCKCSLIDCRPGSWQSKIYKWLIMLSLVSPWSRLIVKLLSFRQLVITQNHFAHILTLPPVIEPQLSLLMILRWIQLPSTPLITIQLPPLPSCPLKSRWIRLPPTPLPSLPQILNDSLTIFFTATLLESCNSRSTPELPELRVLDGTLASAYVLRPCCHSCSVFRRCRRQIKKERRRGVILVDIQAKVHSGVSMSLYTEVKAN